MSYLPCGAATGFVSKCVALARALKLAKGSAACNLGVHRLVVCTDPSAWWPHPHNTPTPSDLASCTPCVCSPLLLCCPLPCFTCVSARAFMACRWTCPYRCGWFECWVLVRVLTHAHDGMHTAHSLYHHIHHACMHSFRCIDCPRARTDFLPYTCDLCKEIYWSVCLAGTASSPCIIPTLNARSYMMCRIHCFARPPHDSDPVLIGLPWRPPHLHHH